MLTGCMDNNIIITSLIVWSHIRSKAKSMQYFPYCMQVCCICPLMFDYTNSQNLAQTTNLWILKFKFFSMGSRSVEPRLATLLRCWTWTEALVVATSRESTRDCYLYKTTGSLGLVSSGVLKKKSAAGGSFVRHRQHWKPLILGER